MHSLYLRAFAVLMAMTSVVLCADPHWSGREAMRTLLPPGSIVGHWTDGEAAFLAIADFDGAVQSAVRLRGSTTILYKGRVISDNAGERKIESLDFAGILTSGYAVLFYREQKMARSAVSFDTGRSDGKLRFIVSGLAPGSWEIWRDGWVIDGDAVVQPREGVLAFESRSGSFFVRRLSAN